MIHRYNVYFEVTDDIEVNVTLSTIQTEKEIIIDYAEQKLEQSGLSIINDHYKNVVIDLLETMK